MTDQLLTDELARLVFGWRLAPDRYLKPHRGWVARSRFRPFTDVRDALRLLDELTGDYSVRAIHGQGFSVEIRSKGRIGKASGKFAARTIMLALAQLFGLDASEAKENVRLRLSGKRDG